MGNFKFFLWEVAVQKTSVKGIYFKVCLGIFLAV